MAERFNPNGSEELLSAPAPRVVVAETATLLALYFSGHLDDQAQAFAYFSGPTTTFLDDINLGFALSRASFTHASPKDLARLLRPQIVIDADFTDLTPPQRGAIESFNLAKVIFSQMPVYADYNLSPVVGNRMAVTPPRNTFELLGRIGELQQFTADVIQGRIDLENFQRAKQRDCVFRPLAFFQTGKEIPARERPNKKQVIEALREIQ